MVVAQNYTTPLKIQDKEVPVTVVHPKMRGNLVIYCHKSGDGTGGCPGKRSAWVIDNDNTRITRHGQENALNRSTSLYNGDVITLPTNTQITIHLPD